MDVQKVLKPKGKVVILCDFREKEVIQHLKEFDVIIKEMALEVGDFACSSSIAIERKRHEDFISSIIDGRIFEQAKALNENFEKPVIIIEGWSDRRISADALNAAIASLITKFGLSLIYSRNARETAGIIYWIARKEQEEKKGEVWFKVGKKPKEIRALQEGILASFPGIGKVLSRRLLEHFKTLKNVFNASEEDLIKVKGISKSAAKRIRKILTLEYGV